MLPYTPLHHLLLHDFGGAARDDERQPLRRADRVRRRRGARAARRDRRRVPRATTGRSTAAARTPSSAPPSRSAARAASCPGALPLPVAARRPLVAAGAELKSTFCVARGRDAFLSPHLGDLDTELAYRAFRHRPRALPRDARRPAGDDRARPPPGVPRDEVGARAGRRARRRAAPPRARGGLPRRARRDGAGARARLRRHRLRHRRDALGRRAAALRPRVASSASPSSSRCRCRAARRRSGSRGGRRRCTSSWRGGRCRSSAWPRVRESLKVNAPLSSGMGRLFDAVAAVLGSARR